MYTAIFVITNVHQVDEGIATINDLKQSFDVFVYVSDPKAAHEVERIKAETGLPVQVMPKAPRSDWEPIQLTLDAIRIVKRFIRGRALKRILDRLAAHKQEKTLKRGSSEFVKYMRRMTPRLVIIGSAKGFGRAILHAASGEGVKAYIRTSVALEDTDWKWHVPPGEGRLRSFLLTLAEPSRLEAR